ncbi:MAG: glycosyltransferase [Hahellaceae bacterium]|nr:glycosyltransferase [Hahellaceae bacterium]MCP5212002.1 glycosyltransferase [Hahellaceae bacterium]
MSFHSLQHNEKKPRLCKGADSLYFPLLVAVTLTIFVIVYRQLTSSGFPTDISVAEQWVRRNGFAIAMLGFASFLLAWQVSFALRYKSFKRLPEAQLPTVTVVIPAYNEGAQILETVRTVMASEYPHDRVQIICVDDGSKDDTWKWMCQAHQEFSDNVIIARQPFNQGKREALMSGFAKATGEVVVTLDSDSEVLPNTLAELVSPFVADARIGSVAGNVRVLNLAAGMIPKMLEVSFTSAFDFIRAGQSVYGGVFCTPGALSAYRTSVLLSLIGEWSKQTFMGKPATIGEDRALTNLVLASGHRVVYQRHAVVMTKVPTTYTSLRKMLTRWARSNVRESLVMFNFVFSDFRAKGEGANWVRFFSVTQIIRLTVFEALKCALLVALIMNANHALMAIALGCVTAAIIPGTIYLLRHRTTFGFRWALPFNLFWLFSLAWILLWGVYTASNSGWLTRTLPANTNAPVAPSLIDSTAGMPGAFAQVAE